MHVYLFKNSKLFLFGQFGVHAHVSLHNKGRLSKTPRQNERENQQVIPCTPQLDAHAALQKKSKKYHSFPLLE